MLKRDYMIKAIKARAYAWPDWIMSIFGKIIAYPDDRRFDYQLHRTDEGFYFINPEMGGEMEAIEDADINEIFCKPHETVIVRPGDLENIDKNYESNYGSLVFNAIILVEPFGSTIPYIPHDIRTSQIEKTIAKLLTDTPDNPADKKPGLIYVDDYTDKYGKNFLYLLNFIHLFAPGASPRSLTSDPRAKEYRDKRIAELKKEGKEKDKVELARLEAELVKIDKEWLAGDYGKDFYVNDKMIVNARKKLHGIVGIDGDFGEVDGGLIETSLSEGINPDNFHILANSARYGSFARSSETQISGAKAKEIARALQNYYVDMEDCGVTFGDKFLVTEDLYGSLLSLYYFDNGLSVEITEDNVKDLIGKVIEIRTPALCKSKKFCKKCVGTNVSRNANDIISSATDVMTTFVQATMKRMHDTTIKTTDIDLENVCF